jgi:hypothetical protein
MGVKVGLEDEDSCHAVHCGGALGDTQFGFAEQAIGLDRRQALIPEMHRQGKTPAKRLGKGTDFLRLAAFGAAHAERIANHDFADVMVPNRALQEFKVSTLVLATNSFEALSGNAEGVGDCHANCLGADIQTENTRVRGVRRLVRNRRGGVRFNGHSYIIGAHI